MDYNAQLVFSVQQEYVFERFSYMQTIPLMSPIRTDIRTKSDKIYFYATFFPTLLNITSQRFDSFNDRAK